MVESNNNTVLLHTVANLAEATDIAAGVGLTRDALEAQKAANESQMKTNQGLVKYYKDRIALLPPELRDEAMAEITQIESDLRDPNVGSLANRFSDLQKSVERAEKVAGANASAALFDAIDQIKLSAASLARVNDMVHTLREGSAADYYMKSFDVDLDPKTKAFVSADIEKNPEVKKTSDAAKDVPPEIVRKVETRYEKTNIFVRDQIATAATAEERAAWEDVEKYKLMRMDGIGDSLAKAGNASPEELRALVDKGIAERVKLGRSVVDSIPRYTPQGDMLIKHYSADGHSIGDDELRKLLVDGNSKEAHAAVKALASAGGDYSKLPPEQAKLAAAGLAVHSINANYSNQTVLLSAVREIYKERGLSNQGNDQHFEQIFDKSLPQKDRVELLIKDIREHGGEGASALSDAQLQRQAREMVRNIDTLSNPRESVLGLNGYKYETDVFRAKATNSLSKAGISEQGASALLRLAESDPTSKATLEGAMRILGNKGGKYSAEDQKVTLERLQNAAHVLTSPDYQQSISKFRYYNLSTTLEGQQLFNRMLTGSVSAAETAQQIEAMQSQVLGRMDNMREIVSNFVQDESKIYLDRVSSMPGMLNADGTLNVEAIIEKARANRDSLGNPTTEQLGKIAEEAYANLSDERKDMRALARIAGHFKATDLIRNFGSQINEAYSEHVRGTGTASAALEKDNALYRAMTDPSDPKAQREAIDEFLKREQYYRSSEEVRTSMTNFVMEVSRAAPELLRSNDFLGVGAKSEDRISIIDYMRGHEEVAAEQQPAAPALPAGTGTADIPAEQIVGRLRKEMEDEGATNEGDLTFETRMEDRLKDVMKKVEMKDIVAQMGGLLGKYNEGNQNNITVHEVENMLAAGGITEIAQLGDSNRPTLDQIIDGLKRAQVTLATNGGEVQGAEVSSAGVPNYAPQGVSGAYKA